MPTNSGSAGDEESGPERPDGPPGREASKARPARKPEAPLGRYVEVVEPERDEDRLEKEKQELAERDGPERGRRNAVGVPPDAPLDEKIVPRRRVHDGQEENDDDPDERNPAPRRPVTGVREHRNQEHRRQDEDQMHRQVGFGAHRPHEVITPAGTLQGDVGDSVPRIIFYTSPASGKYLTPD